MARTPTSPVRAGNLTADVTSFVGRRTERREIRRLLSTSRLISITGFGGVGKTRLATCVARDVHRAFRDGVWFADLSMLADPVLLPNTVATAFGLSVESTESVQDALIDHLASRSTLVVMDNCEQLLEASAALVSDLLRMCPELHVIVTSREPLGVLGEVTVSITPLPVADVDAADLTDYDGISLFLDRARTACPDFEITAQNRSAVIEICRRLDGIPLALELAAVRLRGLSATELAEQLSHHLRLLNEGNRSGPDRQRTLRDCVSWSHRHCTPDEQSLWALISVFTGGMDLDSVTAVCGDDRHDDEETADDAILETLLALVNKSIVTAEISGHRTRYHMLEVIKAYGREHLAVAGLLSQQQTRHSEYFLDMVDRSQSQAAVSREREWTARLRLEHANLRGAFQFCSTDPILAAAALHAVIQLQNHWITTGTINEARHWLEVLTTAAGPTSRETTAAAMQTSAWLVIVQGDLATVDKLIAQRRAFEEKSDELTSARFDHVASLLATYRSEWADAIALSSRALTHFTTADTIRERISCLLICQLAHQLSGESRESLAWHRRVLAVSDGADESWHRSYSLWCAGLAYWQIGDAAEAHRAMRTGLQIKHGLTDVAGIATCLESLAWLHKTQAPQHAAVLLGAAASHWKLATASQNSLGILGQLHEQAVGEVRRELGDRRFDQLFRQGENLTRDEAVTLAMRTEPEPTAAPPAAPSALTEREQEVADLVAHGLNNKEIANTLVISPRTAETHVQHILTKLGFRARGQIAAWVLEK